MVCRMFRLETEVDKERRDLLRRRLRERQHGGLTGPARPARHPGGTRVARCTYGPAGPGASSPAVWSATPGRPGCMSPTCGSTPVTAARAWAASSWPRRTPRPRRNGPAPPSAWRPGTSRPRSSTVKQGYEVVVRDPGLPAGDHRVHAGEAVGRGDKTGPRHGPAPAPGTDRPPAPAPTRRTAKTSSQRLLREQVFAV